MNVAYHKRMHTCNPRGYQYTFLHFDKGWIHIRLFDLHRTYPPSLYIKAIINIIISARSDRISNWKLTLVYGTRLVSICSRTCTQGLRHTVRHCGNAPRRRRTPRRPPRSGRRRSQARSGRHTRSSYRCMYRCSGTDSIHTR